MKTLKKLFAAAFGLASIGSAFAQDIPPAGEPKDFAIPKPISITYENGLKATFVQYGTVPKVTISVRVRAGDLNAPEHNGIAGLLASMMEEGTGSRSSRQLAFEAAGMGGELSVSGGTSEISAGIDVISDHAGEAIALLSDVIMNPALPESELPRIKQNALRSLSVTLSQPQAQAQKAFSSLIYGDHIYGKPFAEPQTLSALSVADLRSFHEGEFGAKRTHIYVVGRFDENAVRTAIDEGLAQWHEGPDVITDIPEQQAGLRVHFIDRPDAPQSTIFLGLPVPDIASEDKTAIDVMNTMLGGSFISRITANIREDKGYTYSPRSSVDDYFGASHWVQVADVSTDVTAESLKEIFHEIDRLTTEPFDADELRNYQNFRAGVFVLQNASRGGILGQLASLNFYGLPRERLTNFVANTMAITPGIVRDMTAQHIAPERMTLVIVGDLEKIREKVEALPQFEGAEITVSEGA